MKEYVLYRCTVTNQDGTEWTFCVPDIHTFCVKMYDYFSEKVDVFSVRVEREAP